VGGLGPGVAASDLSQLFVRCGEVEGISRDPGRTFAFVSFRREQDAVAAVRELQGARLRGAPIRIEFSKGVSVELPPASTAARRAFFELFMCFSYRICDREFWK
jgi:RNA recognition motif-containing protein